MKWKAEKQSERGAQGNHTDWEMISHDTEKKRVFIRCTCHERNSGNADCRWIKESQVL